MTRTDSVNDVGTPKEDGKTNKQQKQQNGGGVEGVGLPNITPRPVRHDEELNLISPERRGTVRIYRSRDRTRLNLILRGKRLGFPLEEIRTIIDLYNEPTGQGSQLRYVLDQIHDRRGHLERRRRDIEDALNELDEFERRCQSDLEQLGELCQQPGPSSV